MRWFKKIVRAFLALLPLFAIFFIPSNVSALSYPIDSIPLQADTYQFRKIKDSVSGDDIYTYFIDRNNFGITSISNSSFDSNFQFPRTWRFSGNYLSGTNSCELPSFNNSTYYSDGVNHASLSSHSSWQFTLKNPRFSTALDDRNLYSSDSPFVLSSTLASQLPNYFNTDIVCSLVNSSYNESSHNANSHFEPEWDFSSLINIPLVNNRFEYERSKPYTYQFDTIDINGRTRGDDGIIYTHSGVSFSEIFHSEVHDFSSFVLSFNDFTSDPSVYLSDDDYSNGCSSDFCNLLEDVYSFQLKGSLEFSDSYSINSNGNSKISFEEMNYYNPNLSLSNPNSGLSNTFDINGHHVYSLPYESASTPCSFTESHTDSGDETNRLDFVCTYNPSSDGGAFSPLIRFRFLDFHIVFSNSDSQGRLTFDSFLNTDGDITLKDFYIVTNNNSAPSGWSGSPSGTGGDPERAPGDIGGDSITDLIPDYLSSLKNLFTFNVLNPFAPLTDNFTHSNDCVNISNLASIIHSSETTYCPWFDSSTRDLLTPILSWASVMILFGFFVHWLNGSSGNILDDNPRSLVIGRGPFGGRVVSRGNKIRKG